MGPWSYPTTAGPAGTKVQWPGCRRTGQPLRVPRIPGIAAALLVAAATVGAAGGARGQEPAPPEATPAAEKKSLRDLLTDDEDGRLDASELIFSRAKVRFLPVPIVVTEPAVGYGGGLGAIFFHQLPDLSTGQLVTPSVSVVAGLGTSDGSKAGGVGHFHSWRQDTWRALGFAGRASLDLASTGSGLGAATDRALAYDIDATLVLLEGSRKVMPRLRLGLRYVYVDSEVALTRDDAGAPPIAGGLTLSGLSPFVSYDTRDSMVTPRRGQRLDLRPTWFDGAFGSDADFLRVDVDYTGYWQHGPWCGGARLDADFADDDAPFYAKPYVALRGVPAMQQLGERVLSAELEVGRDLDERWTLVAFAGAGEARNDLPARGRIDSDVYSGGLGFRYLLARILGLRAGIDVAASSEGETALYLVVGSPWR